MLISYKMGNPEQMFPQPAEPGMQQNGNIFLCQCLLVASNIMTVIAATKNLYENRMFNQLDNWRANGPELLL